MEGKTFVISGVYKDKRVLSWCLCIGLDRARICKIPLDMIVRGGQRQPRRIGVYAAQVLPRSQADAECAGLRLRCAVQIPEVLERDRAPMRAAPADVWLWHGTKTFKRCVTPTDVIFPGQALALA